MIQFRDNEELRSKLAHFMEQYEIREQHYSHQLRTKDLEMQLMQAKFAREMELVAVEVAKVMGKSGWGVGGNERIASV